MNGAQATVILEGASKWYGDVIGVNQIGLTFGPGVTGLLGPNGAGKSTLMKLVTGQLKPGSGTVRVRGMDPCRDAGAFRELGYCPDTDSFYEDMSGLEFVTVMGRLTGYGAAEARQRASRALDRAGLTDARHRRIRGYSKGMRQRTKLAAALVHDPPIVLLDEPLNGLDPVGRRQMLQIFREMGAEGRTVIVSSHILHEIENLTTRIALLHHGRMLAEGDIAGIRELIENQPLTLQLDTPDARAMAKLLVAIEGVSSVTLPDTGGVVARTARPELLYETVQEAAAAGRVEVAALTALDDNLDAVFQYLVKE